VRNRSLALADGCDWLLSATDECAQGVVERLGEIMQLHVGNGARTVPSLETRQLVLTTSARPHALDHSRPDAIRAVRRGETAQCDLELADANEDLLFAQIMQLTTLFGAEAQIRGGALIHGALAARPNPQERTGILLTAPGGTGKTTASNRLPPSWISQCDDTTLIVRAADGEYWAHPWPTWSRFLWGGTGGSWPTQDAVRLCAIFFLEQAPLDQASPLGEGHAAASLVQSIEQASRLMVRGLDAPFARELRMEWFEVASALTRCHPCFHLQLTLTGPFWQEIERCLQHETA
jgi:SynChlorMet cassette protein ScmC